MERKIQYAYSYDFANDVYFVRRLDEEQLGGFIPAGLFRKIAMERVMETGNPVIIGSVSDTYHFSADGTRAFIDLNARKFTPEEEATIFKGNRISTEFELLKPAVPEATPASAEPEKKKNGFQKVLSIFRKKH